MVSAEYVRQILDYDALTGIFFWKIKVGMRAVIGQPAGSIGQHGYLVIGISGKVYQAHRLVWLWITGEWPQKDIDHKNLIKNDNRWSNLRLASDKENCANRAIRADSQTGFKGVSLRKSGKYRARIQTKDGNRLHLGDFDTAELAHAAYANATKIHHGSFARAA